MKNLVGDNISPKVKKEKGIDKTICFAKIICPEFEQFGVFSNAKLNLNTVLEQAFSRSNDSYNDKDGCYVYKFGGHNYAISIIENSDEFYFGQISTEKEFNDVLEEYKTLNNENIKSIIIRYFTFFYIDIKKKAIVYIGQKGIANIKKLFEQYFNEFSKASVTVQYLGNSDLLNQVEKSKKLYYINFQIADNGDVAKSLDKTLQWDRNINSYEIQIKIKKPTGHFLKQILTDANRHIKIKNPVLKFQDESFNEYVTHLFDDYFTVKSVIYSDEIDLGKYEKIKNKLILAMNQYVV